MKRIGVVLSLVLALALLAGCAIPLGDGNAINIGKQGLSVKGEDGEQLQLGFGEDGIQFSLTDKDGESFGGSFSTKVPANFPKDVPIPNGADNVAGFEARGEDNTMMTTVQYTIKAGVKELQPLYANYMRSAGYEITSAEDAIESDEGSMTIITGERGSERFSVTIMNVQSEGSSVILSYGAGQ